MMRIILAALITLAAGCSGSAADRVCDVYGYVHQGACALCAATDECPWRKDSSAPSSGGEEGEP